MPRLQCACQAARPVRPRPLTMCVECTSHLPSPRRGPANMSKGAKAVVPLWAPCLYAMRPCAPLHNHFNFIGGPHSGGVPNERRLLQPHPGGQAHLPAGFNGVLAYEMARQTDLARLPENAGELDPLLLHAPASAARARYVTSIVGHHSAAWIEIVDGRFARFRHAYLSFLNFY